MPEPSTAATEITGDVTALFTPQLYTSGISLDGDAVTGVGIIKLADISNAHITVAAYDDSGIMLDSQTVTDDFSEVNINEKATIPVSFNIPQDTAEIQVIVYDGNETLNALSPVYATDVNSVSLMATYDNGTIEVRQDLGRYTGKEAICLITDADSGETVYIRQETVGENTFKTITTGELDSTYNVNIGVSGNGMVITEKAYTEKHIETDNPEKSETLYSWDFSEESQTASQGSNIPVLGGNAAYDSGNQAVKMTSTDKSGGKMSVTFDEPVKTVQGQEITVVSKIAYGREDGKYMDYTITDSNGNELVGSHISIYSGSTAQSLRIGGEEQLNGGLPTVETDASGYIKYSTGSSTTGGYMTFGEINTETKTVHITADVKFTPATEAQSNGKIGNSQFAISNVLPSFSGTNITYGINSSCRGHIIVFEYNSGKTLAVNGKELSIDFIGDWMHLEADVNFSDKSASITVTNDSGLKAEFEDAKIYSSSFDGNIGSYYMRGAGAYGMVSADNITVKVTGDGGERVPNYESDINFKSVYAFGDSIVYGDEAPQESFMQFIADDYAVDLNMMAKNGATVMPGSNSIISQVNNAPEEAPDFVVFDGYTNDAYGSADSDEFNSSGSHKDITQCYGEITPEGTEEFDTSGLFFYMHKKTSS